MSLRDLMIKTASNTTTKVLVCLKGLNFGLFGINVLIAAGSVMGNYLGSLLLIQPSPLTPIWPGAGIAFSGIFFFGVKVVPGVIIGAFCSEILSFRALSSAFSPDLSFSIAIAASIATSLQAFVGAYLVKRCVRSDESLFKETSILCFTILAGPVSCLISASIVIGLLYILDGFDFLELLKHWLLWWASDTFGFLIISPILLCVWDAFRVKQYKRLIWVALPMVFLAALTLVILKFVKIQEQDKVVSYFDKRVDVLNSELQNQFGSYLQSNETLVAFFNGSVSVTADEFRRFSQTILNGRPEVISLAWLPRVTINERAVFEKSIGKSFTFSDEEFGSAKNNLATVHRNVYFPVIYVEPFVRNRSILGFDFYSKAAASDILMKAVQNSQSVLSLAVSLHDKTPSQRIVSIYSPVYKQNSNLASSGERLRSLLGLVASEINPILKVEIIQNQFKYFNLLMKITDGDEVILDQNQVIPAKYGDIYQFERIKNLRIADRVWQINYSAAPDFYGEMISWNQWWLFSGCALFTVLTGMGLLMLTGRMMQTETLIETRTQALVHEIEERKQAENALKESETRLTLAIKGSNDAPWDWDLEHNRIYYSPQWWRMLGYEPDELSSTTELRHTCGAF